MFERYDERARRVVTMAQERARHLHHHHIGAEHLLLALLDDHGGNGARLLAALDVDAAAAEASVVESAGRGGASPPDGHIPFTPGAKRILEQSLRVSQRLGYGHVGTEHLLLALLRERDDVAARVLDRLGVDPDAAAAFIAGRLEAGAPAAVSAVLSAPPPPDPAPAPVGRPHPGLVAAATGIVALLAAIVAVAVPRPLSGAARAALILLAVAVPLGAGGALAAATGRHHGPGTWLPAAGAALAATAAWLLLVDTLAG